MRGARSIPTLLLLLLALPAPGCTCDEERELGVSGDTGYVRCHAAEAAAGREWSVGELTLTREDRRLTIAGAPERTRLVVGAGSGAEPVPVDAIRALRPHLVAVLGELGDPALRLAEWARIGVPVLVLAGGTDRFSELAAGLEALEGDAGDRIVDATVLRAIRLGPLELVPVAGAPDGRYASDEHACGFSEDDLDDWDLGDPEDGVHRVILSWAGPAGAGPHSASRGLAGIEAGAPLVARLAEQVGAPGALFAWPRTAAGAPEAGGEALSAGASSWATRLAVAPMAGPAVARFDGRRVAAAPTLVLVGPDGLSIAPSTAAARLDRSGRTD